MTLPQLTTPTVEIFGPGEGAVHVVGRPHPLRDDLVEVDLPSGLTIEEMLQIVCPKGWRLCNVTVGGEPVPPEWWPRVRPKPGSHMTFRRWVRGGNIGRTIMAIALLAVAAWAGPAVAGLLLPGAAAGSTALVATAGLIQAGVALVGSLLINAVAPPPTQDSLGASPGSMPGIRGSQNRAAPFEPIPLVLGRHLVVPLLGAQPFTEQVGDDQYLRMLFVVGYGPLLIQDIRIGDTPIVEFEEVEIEVREGRATDAPHRLYPGQVFQEDLSVELDYETSWVTRTTAFDIDEATVDLVAPNGVGTLSRKKGWRLRRLQYRVMYRKLGTVAWWDAGLITFEERLPTPRRRSMRVKFPARGQYQVRVRRITTEEVEQEGVVINATVVWTALQSIRNDPPIQLEVPLATIALRIKATDQLNGIIDDLSCIATSYAPDWNGTAWVERPTRNPAALYRRLFMGPHLKQPVPASRIDDAAMVLWYAASAQAGRTCDAVIQSQKTLLDAARDVASTGRAAFMMRDGLYSVRRDVPQTVPAQMITGRNIIGLHGERVFTKHPDALRVQFISAAAGYQIDEIVVPGDGFTPATAVTYDTLDLWGVTNATQAYREARYHIAVAKLRPERLTVQMDVEHLVARPGNLVRVAHDVMLVGLAQGRIVSQALSGDDTISITLDEDCVMEPLKDYTVYIRRSNGTTNENLEVIRLVALDPGVQRTLTFRVPIPPDLRPTRGDLVAFGEAGFVKEDWLVLSIEPQEDLHATLTLVPAAPGVHDADQGPIGDYRPRTTLPIAMRNPPPPIFAAVVTGDVALEQLPNGHLMPRIIATLRLQEGFLVPPIARVIAQARRSSGSTWTDEQITVEGMTRVVLRGVETGDRYDLRARTVSDYDRLSPWAVYAGIEVIGAEERPGNLAGLQIEVHGTTATLFWPEPPDIDVAYYIVRHSRATSGATWANAVTLPLLSEKATSVEVPLLVGTYMVKLVDNQGRTSEVAAAVSTTVPRINGLNFVEDYDAHPAFDGTLENAIIDPVFGGLRLGDTDGEEHYVYTQEGDVVETQPGVPLVIWETGRVFQATGLWTQDAADAIDIGGVFTCEVKADLEVLGVDLTEDVFQWIDVFAQADVFGGASEAVTVQAYLQTTEDPVDGDEVWSDWREFRIGTFTGRGFRFRLQLLSSIPGMTPVVVEATFVVDMPDRVWSTRLTVPAGGTTVSFDSAFYVRPDIGLTIQGGAAGDRPTYTADEDSITLQVLNSGGSGVSRVVEIFARAYGERE